MNISVLPISIKPSDYIYAPIVGLSANTINPDIYVPRKYPVSNRMRNTTYQGRMGVKLDKIKTKLLDNQLRLYSHPTDMIRIQATRDERSQDLISRTIQSAEVLPIILPVMKDIPLREFSQESNKSVLIPALYPINDKSYFEIYTPLETQLDMDDLLFRIIYIANNVNPYCMCLQVKEILSTIAYSTVLYNKYNVTFYDEKIPTEIVELLKEAAIKRDKIGW